MMEPQILTHWIREELTDQPVIGIVSQNVNQKNLFKNPEVKKYKSFIASCYVKYLSALGARVVPLIMDEHEELLKQKLRRVNGVLFPGGNHKEGSFGATGQFIFNYAK